MVNNGSRTIIKSYSSSEIPTVTYGNLAGKYIDPLLLSNPQQPVDQLLRWHFRQSVLANMRGSGEPILEHDFPPGSDVMGEILGAPKATEMMEAELFGRLGAHIPLFPQPTPTQVRLD
jgi:hypothetical protein